MSGADAPAPFRIAFDNARDPYTARNALGITSTGGGGGGAPTDAQYITAAADPTLTNEMVLTDTATVTWDFSTPGQAKANASAGGGGGGNVSNSGTPVLGQYAKWVTATTIQGVSPATVLSDIGAQPAGSYLTTAAAAATYQPLDADLTALAALTGTNTIYYRSAANTWSPVNVSTGLSFTGGNLTATGGGGTPGGSTTQVQYNNAGAFGGAANLTWNNGSSVLTLAGTLSITLGGNSFVSAGVVEGASFKCTGTVAVLGPGSAGNVALRPNGVASATGQLLVAASGAVTVAGAITLPADPTTALQAATKQMVDAKAPLAAEYITSTADATLTAERVLTDTATVTWDRTTAGQIKANAVGGGGGGGGLLAIRTFSTAGSTTYTPTAGMVNCIIECVGAGGGGGASGGVGVTVVWGGGGGAGGYSRAFKTAADIGASINVTVGAAGTGSSTANGTAGGDSFVGANLAASLCGANGGSGGIRGSVSIIGQGGAGGALTGAVGDFKSGGAPGGPGGNFPDAASVAMAGLGTGGSGPFGGGGAGRPLPASAGATVGLAAVGAGSGGGGAVSYTSGNAAGGAGSAGLVIITEYK